MARILITSGPTRQYIDPVRYFTNASSGRMGRALTQAAAEQGHEVIVISGPADVDYPGAKQVVPVVSTEEMLQAAEEIFPRCDGLIGVAAPCDYRPVRVQTNKITKTGRPLELHLIETPDVVATLGARKKAGQWVVGFALETEDHRFRALIKLEKKSCDLMVLNGPQAMHSLDNHVELTGRSRRMSQAETRRTPGPGTRASGRKRGRGPGGAEPERVTASVEPGQVDQFQRRFPRRQGQGARVLPVPAFHAARTQGPALEPAVHADPEAAGMMPRNPVTGADPQPVLARSRDRHSGLGRAYRRA